MDSVPRRRRMTVTKFCYNTLNTEFTLFKNILSTFWINVCFFLIFNQAYSIRTRNINYKTNFKTNWLFYNYWAIINHGPLSTITLDYWHIEIQILYLLFDSSISIIIIAWIIKCRSTGGCLLFEHQLGSRVVRAFVPCLAGPDSNPGRVKPKISNW